MDDVKKFANACRICLDLVSKGYVSLFQNYEDSSLHNYVNTISNVGITEGDGFPDKICLSCLLELKTAIKFKQNCEKTDLLLRNKLVLCKSETEECKIEIKQELEVETEFLDSNTFDSGDFYNADNNIETKNINQTPKSRAIDLKLECHDCGGIFKSKCKLRVHWKKVHQPKYFKCDKCKQIFKSLKAYNHHMQRNLKSCKIGLYCRIEGEGQNRIFYCKDCDYKTPRANDIDAHIVIHNGERPFKCEICPKTYTQLGSLQQHKESAHKEFRVELTCQYCGKFVKGRQKVYRHLQTHIDKSVQCDICKKVLKCKRYLQEHMLRHSGIKNYICKTCGAMFYTIADLCAHKIKKHTRDGAFYKCDICEYKATKKETIKRHRVKHTGTNIVCTICGAFYENEQKLVLHQKRHFEKNHECPYCSSQFYRRDTLTAHIRRIHKNIEPKKLSPVVVKQEPSPKINQSDGLTSMGQLVIT